MYIIFFSKKKKKKMKKAEHVRRCERALLFFPLLTCLTGKAVSAPRSREKASERALPGEKKLVPTVRPAAVSSNRHPFHVPITLSPLYRHSSAQFLPPPPRLVEQLGLSGYRHCLGARGTIGDPCTANRQAWSGLSSWAAMRRTPRWEVTRTRGSRPPLQAFIGSNSPKHTAGGCCNHIRLSFQASFNGTLRLLLASRSARARGKPTCLSP